MRQGSTGEKPGGGSLPSTGFPALPVVGGNCLNFICSHAAALSNLADTRRPGSDYGEDDYEQEASDNLVATSNFGERSRTDSLTPSAASNGAVRRFRWVSVSSFGNAKAR